MSDLEEVAKQAVMDAAIEAWQEHDNKDVPKEHAFMLGFIKGATWQIDQ